MDCGLPSPLLDPLCWSFKNDKVKKKKKVVLPLASHPLGATRALKLEKQRS